MALPSQQSSVVVGRSAMVRRRRGKRRPMAAVIVVALACGVAWAGYRYLPLGGDEDGAGGATDSPQLSGQSNGPNSGLGALANRDEQSRQSAASREGAGSRDSGVRREPEPPVEVRMGNSPSNPAEGGLAAAPEEQPVSSEVGSLIASARSKRTAGDPVTARVLLSRALAHPRITPGEAVGVRQELAAINEDLVFSPRIDRRDPFVLEAVVEGGDALSKIATRLGVPTHWKLIQRVNGLSNPNRIRVGQRLKVVTGPFHAVVHKSEFRLDVYLGSAELPSEWVYVRSFPVGLGEADGTPTGSFVVRSGSKLENPAWTNPRTGDQYASGDPKNPIGKHWIGLDGVGAAAVHQSYGIHGTIDPSSIGRQMSMGCVRMHGADVALVYELLGQGSRVEIRP